MNINLISYTCASPDYKPTYPHIGLRVPQFLLILPFFFCLPLRSTPWMFSSVRVGRMSD